MMTQAPAPKDFAASAEKELHEGILQFWLDHGIDEQHGGFVGEADANGAPVAGAAKGLVLNARILWTFATAAQRYPDRPRYRAAAQRAYDWFMAHFVDPDHGGAYWSVTPEGRPLDDRKQVYGQAFAIYGLSAYHALTGDARALDTAINFFELMEEHALETHAGGYLESLARDWTQMHEMRLSERDLEAPKSFNTNLHALEAYTALLEHWKDDTLADALADLVRIHLDEIFDGHTDHFRLFFDNNWKPLSDVVSYGHDIEAVWLIHRAAEQLEDPELVRRARDIVGTVAASTLRDGMDPEQGGLYYEGGLPDGKVDMDKHWWPQVEAAVGFLDAHALAKDDEQRDEWYNAAWNCWDFAQRRLRDRDVGEWYFRTDRAGKPYPDQAKISFWKCPYHNARACLEITRRLRG